MKKKIITGSLKPIIIEAGVTDNSYTEVVKGKLSKGHQVITGVVSGKESTENSRSSDAMGGMMRALR